MHEESIANATAFVGPNTRLFQSAQYHYSQKEDTSKEARVYVSSGIAKSFVHSLFAGCH